MLFYVVPNNNISYRYGFAPQDIYNLDETGISTVQSPGNVVTQRGKKQVGSTSSQERGELTTLCCAISASGNHIPPFYIFPRVFMKQCFMNGCTPGAKGVAIKSGYMNTKVFAEEYLPFFITSVHCSKDRPVLLILDNHCSHVSIAAIELCRSSGIHLLTLPPHTSHKLQPLDRCVFGPLKKYFNRAMDEWMRSNPGRCVSIYEIASLSATAFSRSVTPENIHSAFKCTGIYPFNSMIFQDHEFISASVTDQPLPSAITEIEEQRNATVGETSISETVSPPALTPVRQSVPDEPQPSTSQITPQQILPLPKAGPRKPSNRRKVKSAIVTDTPEKERIEMENAERAAKKRPKVAASRRLSVKRKASTAAVCDSSTEEEELAKEMVESDSDISEEENMELGEIDMECEDLKPGVYVLVRFITDKQNQKLYAGKIISKVNDYYEVRFMRKVKGSAASFMFPDKDDITSITFNDIILILGLPVNIAGTKRAASRVMFRVDLGGFIIE